MASKKKIGPNICVRLSKVKYDQVVLAGEALGMGTGPWIRMIVLQALRSQFKRFPQGEPERS